MRADVAAKLIPATRVRARVLDAANALSLSRVMMAALVWLAPEDRAWLLVLVVAAAISDGLDGWLGRRAHAGLTGSQNIGAWLDPVCDKIFVLSAAIAIVATTPLSWGALLLLLARDIGAAALALVFRVAGGKELFHAHDFRARWSGKITTGLQVACLVAAMFRPDVALWLAWAAFGVGVIALAERIFIALEQRRREA